MRRNGRKTEGTEANAGWEYKGLLHVRDDGHRVVGSHHGGTHSCLVPVGGLATPRELEGTACGSGRFASPVST